MKKFILLLAIMMIIPAIGCNQRQEKKPAGQTGVPHISPEEIRHLQAAARMAPNDPSAWTTLGNAYMDTNQFNEAVDAYQKALALSPKNVDVRVDLGTCYRNLGKSDLAIQEYKKALAINPNHLNARRNSGVVLAFDLKNKKAAIKEFEKYLELAPNAPDAFQVKQLVADLKAGK